MAIAHRGGAWEAAENSIDAFQYAYDLGFLLVPGLEDAQLLLKSRYRETPSFLDGVTYERVEDPLDDHVAELLRVEGEPYARWVRNTAGYHWPDDDVKWHRLRDEDHPNPWVTLCRIASITTWEGIVAQRPPGRWCNKCLAKYNAAAPTSAT